MYTERYICTLLVYTLGVIAMATRPFVLVFYFHNSYFNFHYFNLRLNFTFHPFLPVCSSSTHMSWTLCKHGMQNVHSCCTSTTAITSPPVTKMYFISLSASCTITDEVGRTMLKRLTLCDLWLVVNESLTWMNFLATQASAKLRNSFTWTKLHAHTGLACYAFLVLRTGSLARHPYSPLA